MHFLIFDFSMRLRSNKTKTFVDILPQRLTFHTMIQRQYYLCQGIIRGLYQKI